MNVLPVSRAVAGLLSIVVLASCAPMKTAPPKPAAVNVDTAVAKRAEIQTTVDLDGQIAPLKSAQLAFTQAGPIVALYAKEGDRVAEGALLGKVDDSSLQAQAVQLEAQIREAAARARSTSYGVPITREQTTAVVKQAQNTLDSDRAALKSAELVDKQNSQLLAQGYVSESAAVAARASYVAAQQKVAIDEQSLTSARANTGQTRVSAANAVADTAAAAAIRAQLNTLRTSITQTSLYAPFAGTITQRLMDPGTAAGPSAPTFELAQTDAVYLNINIPEEDLQYIKRGTQVTFTIQSLPGKSFRAEIGDVNPVPTSGTLSYRARVRVANPQGLLRGGMLADVKVVSGRNPQAVVVPREAVFSNERGQRIFIVTAGKAKELDAKPGLQTDTATETRNTQIKPGTQVITVRPDSLQDGGDVKTGGGKAHAGGAAPSPAPSGASDISGK